MVKFGRKFFFDRVHTKKNYTLPIIITVILIVAITTTFLVTRYFKEDKPKIATPKVVLNKSVEIEIYNELPSISEYIKELKNIKESDLNIEYPEDLAITEDSSACESEEDTDCKKLIASSLGEYQITIKSDKLKETKTVKLNVVDKTAPILKLKSVTITEGTTYKVEDFIESCIDNSDNACKYEYLNEEFSNYTTPGEYPIKIVAIDSSNNKTEEIETKLIINKKKTTSNNNDKKPDNSTNTNNNTTTEKPKTCEYGDLKYSNSYVIATRISDTTCAISAKQAEDLSYKPGIEHNKKLIKEVQSAYLKNTIEKMNLEGEIIYDITYGPVFNTSNKGVVGYYLLSEARQTINGKTTTIARYFIDENGNRVWKVNALNLK